MTDVRIDYANQVINTNELTQTFNGSRTPFSDLTTARLKYLYNSHNKELRKLNLMTWFNIYNVVALLGILTFLSAAVYMAQQVKIYGYAYYELYSATFLRIYLACAVTTLISGWLTVWERKRISKKQGLISYELNLISKELQIRNSIAKAKRVAP